MGPFGVALVIKVITLHVSELTSTVSPGAEEAIVLRKVPPSVRSSEQELTMFVAAEARPLANNAAANAVSRNGSEGVGMTIHFLQGASENTAAGNVGLLKDAALAANR